MLFASRASVFVKLKKPKAAILDADAALKNAEAASVLKDGEIIGVHSLKDLKVKLNAASTASRLAIIYFTAKWCGPCRCISSIYSSLAEKYPKVVLLKVDINEAMEAAAECNVSSIPMFLLREKCVEEKEKVGITIPLTKREKTKTVEDETKGGDDNKKKKEKLGIIIPLTKQEIEEDIFALTGGKNVQRDLNATFLWSFITSETYKVVSQRFTLVLQRKR